METSLTPKARVAKWDNAKALLIILVVWGHIFSAYAKTCADVRTADLIIHSFHIPLFIFISGLFSKSTVDSKSFKYNKIIGFFLLYYFMKLLISITRLCLHKPANFFFFSENSTPWFIFAVAVMYLLTRLVRNYNHLKVLFLSIVLSLLAGFFSEINDTMVSSRIVVFFPFFFLGYMLDRNKILKFVNRPLIRIFSAVTVISFCVISALLCDKVYGIRTLFVGCNSYSELGSELYFFGPLLRLAVYCISALMSVAVLSLIPNARIPLFTYCGTKTLQIFALHRPLVYIYHASILHAVLKTQASWIILLSTLLLSVGLSLPLMLKPFDYVIYPCTNWRSFFAPLLRFMRK